MSPWAFDASTIDVSHLKDPPYFSRALTSFFQSDLGGLKRILVAPKGYGKTLYLKYKSALIRKKYGASIPIYPSGSEDIEFLQLSIDEDEIRRLTGGLQIDTWLRFWQTALFAKGVQMVDAAAPSDDKLKELLGIKTVAGMLSHMLRDRDSFEHNIGRRLSIVQEAFMDSRKDAIIFVDNTDEMFGDPSRLPRAKEKAITGAVNPSSEDDRKSDELYAAEVARNLPKVWRDAQIALMLAIREIERQTSRLRVFTTLRAEAVAASSGEHSAVLQAMTHIQEVQYTREDLEHIFGWHVNMMDEQDLAEPHADKPAERLMGSAPLDHRYVRSGDTPKQEDVFSLLLRHTTFSPRELIVLGEKISKVDASLLRGPQRMQEIRGAVDSAVRVIFDYFQQTSMPRWTAELDQAIQKIKSPIMNRKEVDAALGEAAVKLHGFGLLGSSRETGVPNAYEQKFLTKWDGTLAVDRKLPKADFYFIHPWLFDKIKDNPGFKRDEQHIIGNACDFLPPGKLSVVVRRDLNNKPMIVCNGDQDFLFHGKGSNEVGVFFAASLFACHDNRANAMTKSQLERGRARFNELYPEYTKVKMKDPFGDPEDRAHLKRDIFRSCPSLAEHCRRMESPIVVVSANGTKETHVNFAFLDIEGLRVDL